MPPTVWFIAFLNGRRYSSDLWGQYNKCRLIAISAAVTLMLFQPISARADYLNLSADGVLSPQTSIGLSWDGKGGGNFKLKHKKRSAGTWGPITLIDSQTSGLVRGSDDRWYWIVGNLECGTWYDFRVKREGRGWREVSRATDGCGSPPPTIVSSKAFRLRNVSTNQCLWIDGLRVRHDTCWADPNMAFDVEALSNGLNYLHHKQSSKCIWGKRAYEASVSSAPCGTLGTQFQISTVTGGIQLYIPITKGSGISGLGVGGCLFVSGQNGADALKEKPCAETDTKFTFHLDPA